jgi:tRNA1(Val) A37 N6-methylase TrmN6
MKPRPDHAARMQALGQSLRTGNAVRVVSAPQLFPTPPAVAARMVSFADILPEHDVLEPSAGTGRLLDAIQTTGARWFAVEINHSLCEALARTYGYEDGINKRVLQGDFLEMGPDHLGTFDRILMNPPFERGSDIEHILHARRLLKSDGKLVAICANGPRQLTKLQPLCDHWEDLPAGTFDATGVRTALLVMGAA